MAPPPPAVLLQARTVALSFVIRVTYFLLADQAFHCFLVAAEMMVEAKLSLAPKGVSRHSLGKREVNNGKPKTYLLIIQLRQQLVALPEIAA